MKPARREALIRLVVEQRDWIARCGGSLSGYVARYGSASDPNHYGDGGEAIYEADIAALQALTSRVPARKLSR